MVNTRFTWARLAPCATECLRALALMLLAAIIVTQFAQASGLPKPTRTAYKCEVAGRVMYSDTPCEGGQRVDTTPTRGVDSITGQRRTGADVRAERTNEIMADGLRPIFGETPEQRTTRHRRFKLPASAKARCAQLDREIPAAEVTERSAAPGAAREVRSRLFKLRGEYRGLGC